MLDTVIIGAGPAGLSAAIYAIRAGLSAVVLDKGFYGGQAAITSEIENYPAIAQITGPEFAHMLYEHAKGLGADFRMEEVVKAELSGAVKKIVTSQHTYEARTVIAATGVRRKKLGCPGEAEFSGRGVSYCATCDGLFFREKAVVVVGGGNTALEDALFLSNYCKRVTLVHRKASYRGEKSLVDAVMKRKTIERIMEARVVAIEGQERVGSVRIAVDGASSYDIPAAGVFIAIGYEPDSGLLSGELALTDNGYVAAGEDCRTNLEGVFAAGDCREKPLRQIVTAAADGAVAGYSAAGFINQL